MEKYKHKINYYETDKMGITHHSNYIRFMEEARVDRLKVFSKSLQLSLRLLKLKLELKNFLLLNSLFLMSLLVREKLFSLARVLTAS